MHDLARRAIETKDSIRSLVEEFYGPSGPLAERGWDIRPQQREMSLDIAETMEAYAAARATGIDAGRAQWGFVEALCGTGKGLAYGVPGLFASLRAEAEHVVAVADAKRNGTTPPAEARKLIISTANIALQEQLVKKDFPALAAMLGIEDHLRVVLLKSRSNYLCRMKVRALGGAMMADDRIARLLRWMEMVECDGDKESLDHDPGDVWGDVSDGTDDCTGQACAHFNPVDGDAKPCYWRQSIAGYLKAHIVVTNHHYLAVAKGMKCCLLAVDESHELEDSLRATQARALTPFTGKALVGRLSAVAPSDQVAPVVDLPVRWLMDRATEVLNAQPLGWDRQPATQFVLSPGWMGKHSATAEDFALGLRRMLSAVQDLCQKSGCFLDESGRMMHPPRFKSTEKEASEAAGKLAKSWDQMLGLCERYESIIRATPCDLWPASDTPWAFWLERTKGRAGQERVLAQMAPADVSWATKMMSHKYPVAVFTTATMPAFKPQRIALGLGTDAESAPAPRYEKRLPSPFRLQEQGVLVVPQGPKPNESEWSAWACDQVVEAVRMARGGTLVLASSSKQMRAYAESLRGDRTRTWDVKMQGEAGRGDLRRWFGADLDGVLVATRSFFQGLDVQGDACRCVVIDRIPFARPDDPVEDVVGKLLTQRAGAGSSAYMLRSVPGAAMVLAQGAGRLIRSMTDRGGVLLLDTRLLSPGEGWQAIRAGLPPFPLSRDVGDIRRRIDGVPLAGTGQPVVGRVRNRGAA